MFVASTLLKRSLVVSLSCGAAVGAIAASQPVQAQTQARRESSSLTQGPEGLSRALQRIGRHFGVSITFDSADVGGSQSRVVRDAVNAYDAVVQATNGTGLSYERRPDGSLHVFRRENSGQDIIVTAVRDEAETNLSVNSAASSTRTGKSLRDQPRSTAVVGAKLIADQQVQSIQEALRNVSSTTASGGTQGIPTFTVRGYTATALTNGLNTASGSAQPVAGLERIEVLKGPDVVLAGADNLGGVVNVVTKRPTATPLLNVDLEYASFDDKKITIDASNALNPDRTVSARIVAEAAKAQRTYQGYDGREEYLLAPSLRFKNVNSDLIVGISASTVFSPIPSATIIDKNYTDREMIRAFRRMPLGPKRQGVRLGVTREYFDFTQRVTSWLTLVARGEHAFTTTDLALYLPGFAAQPASTNQYVYNGNAQQNRTSSNAVDSYARLNFATGFIKHTVSAGFNYSRQQQTIVYPVAALPLYQFNLVTGAATAFPPPFNPVTTFPKVPGSTVPNYLIPTRQSGFYIQDFLEIGPLKLIGAVRINKYQNGITFFDPAQVKYNTRANFSSTLPSFGVVYDLLDNVSLYANYQRGYSPGSTNTLRSSTVAGAYTGANFPDIKTRNIEGGLKIDAFNRRFSIVADYYQNRQSNLVDTSTVPGTAFLIPGQVGKGVELDVNGRIMPGWSLVGSVSHTKFSQSQATPLLQVVRAQPEDKYSLFTSYEPGAGPLKGFGVSAGIYGNSRSFTYAGAIDPNNTAASVANRGAFYNGTRRANGTLAQQAAAAGTFAAFRPYVPASRQVDANMYYSIAGAKLTLGVKNLFDRRNYVPTLTSDFIPVANPRTYRATLSFRFY